MQMKEFKGPTRKRGSTVNQSIFNSFEKFVGFYLTCMLSWPTQKMD